MDLKHGMLLRACGGFWGERTMKKFSFYSLGQASTPTRLGLSPELTKLSYSKNKKDLLNQAQPITQVHKHFEPTRSNQHFLFYFLFYYYYKKLEHIYIWSQVSKNFKAKKNVLTFDIFLDFPGFFEDYPWQP